MKLVPVLLLLSVLSLLAGCGGGDSAAPPPVGNIVTGTASAGIVKGGRVRAFTPYSSLTGADKRQVGSDVTTSLIDGSYSIDIGSYSGPLVVEVTGGSYVDEADGSAGPKTIPADAPLRAAVSSASGTVTVAVTPLTELAVKQARTLDKRLGPESIDTANAQISDLFKVDIINTAPLDASRSISAGAPAEKDYTIVLAAISQLVKSSGNSLDLTIRSLEESVNSSGRMDAGAVSAVMTALTTFLADTANNKTGVTAISDNLKNIGKTTLKVMLKLSGNGVKSLEATIALPVGVTVAVDSTGATLNGVLVPLIGGTNTLLSGSATGPGMLKLVLLNWDRELVIRSGDIVSIAFQLDPAAEVPSVAAFTFADYTLFDANGAEVAGRLTLH